MKQMFWIIYLAISLLLASSAMAASGSVIRKVSNENPSFGDTITVTLDVTLTDTDANPNNQFISIREPKPTWGFTLGNFQLDASEPTIISVVKVDQPAGTKTYSYTVTAPGSASTLSFTGGQYQVGEGQQMNSLTATGGVSSLSVGGGGPSGGEETTTTGTDNTMLYVFGGALVIGIIFFATKKN